MQLVPHTKSKDTEEYLSSVSPKGQITVPSAIRQMLRVKPKDKIAFSVTAGKVQMARARSRLDASFQAVPALSKKLTDKQLTELATEEHTKEVAQEGL